MASDIYSNIPLTHIVYRYNSRSVSPQTVRHLIDKYIAQDFPQSSWLKFEAVEDSTVKTGVLAARRVNLGCIEKYAAMVAYVNNSQTVADVRLFLKSLLNVTDLDSTPLVFLNKDVSEYDVVVNSINLGFQIDRRYINYDNIQEDSAIAADAGYNYEKRKIQADEESKSVEGISELSAELLEFEAEVKDKERRKRMMLEAITMLINQYLKENGELPDLAKIYQIGDAKIALAKSPVRLIIDENFEVKLESDDEQDSHAVFVKLNKKQKALYIWFLQHKEGIQLKAISDKTDEITAIYMNLFANSNKSDKKMKQTISNMLTGENNSLLENISLIKHIFNSLFADPEMAKKYYISGKRGEAYMIALPREYVTIPKFFENI